MVGVRGWCLGRWRRARDVVQSLGKQAEDVGAAARRRSSAAWRAAKEWARSNPPSVIALAITLLAIAVLVVEWWLIGGKTILALDAFDLIGEPEKKVEAYGKLLPAMGLLAAAPVGVAGVALAFWRSWNQHRDGLTAIRKLDAEAYAKAAEAFAKAVEQLGHDKSSIRMGAVLALEALGTSTPRLLSQTIEVLCAYVREMRPVSTETNRASTFPPSSTEIQLILDIINRLRKHDAAKRIPIDLSYTDLRRAGMGCIDLTSVKLNESNLSDADLLFSNLHKAYLSGANLSRASLDWADLSETILRFAKLIETEMRSANLRRADLIGAKLNGAYLNGAKLDGADLTEADLSKADLSKADLSGATLTNTIFSDTTLPDGTVWTGKGPPPGFPPAPVTNA
jgi:uncharacterized protein YjbI with pentapeptide repeats